jgi:FAD:protein FMN transferase
LRRVETIMGTVVSLDVRDAVPEAAVEEAFASLHEADARFSTYRSDSEISRLNRGEVRGADASPDMRLVLDLCDRARRATEGYFDAAAHRADGTLDPSGLVKGWAVERAAGILDWAGASSYCLSAGGDVLARGEPEPGRPWRVGIQHPLESDKLAAVALVSDLAVATSGAYERGQHITDPHTGQPPAGLLSVTVVGPSLTDADVYATAAFAMGAGGMAWVARLPGYAACGVTLDRRLVWTPGFQPLLDRSATSEREHPERDG